MDFETIIQMITQAIDCDEANNPSFDANKQSLDAMNRFVLATEQSTLAVNIAKIKNLTTEQTTHLQAAYNAKVKVKAEMEDGSSRKAKPR